MATKRIRKGAVRTPSKAMLRVIVEMGSIMFLFYSNLLMGEYTHSHNAQRKNLLWAMWDIFTFGNFAIATASALLGYLIFEYFRKHLADGQR